MFLSLLYHFLRIERGRRSLFFEIGLLPSWRARTGLVGPRVENAFLRNVGFVFQFQLGSFLVALIIASSFRIQFSICSIEESEKYATLHYRDGGEGVGVSKATSS